MALFFSVFVRIWGAILCNGTYVNMSNAGSTCKGKLEWYVHIRILFARAESCGAEIKVVRIGVAPHLHLNRKAFLLQTHEHGNLRSASYESLFSPSIPSCAPVSHSFRSCGAFQVIREENQRVILPMTQPLQVWHLSALPSGRTRASKGCACDGHGS